MLPILYSVIIYMKKKHFFLLFFLIACGLTSCGDEDERFYLYELSEVYDPNIPVSSVYVPITEGRSVVIMGGEAPYTVELSNSQLATATLSEEGDIIHLSPIRLGTTTLVVTDARGERTQIEVKVDVGMESFRVSEVVVDISDDLDEATADELKERILQDARMQPKGGIRWTYKTKESGTMALTYSSEEGESMMADFTKETLPAEDGGLYFLFRFVFSGETHGLELRYGYPRVSEGSRSISPTPSYLAENVTDVYKEQYPSLQNAVVYYIGFFIW